ncbi:MAG: type II toxin-antitoxin system PemK/MazF family toxin [Candidatus Parcubacteria bacterium]|nr:type II toxin-antitoxin system PemK/MazF family toxin [Candidatus Parcubacteria bacterium]
MKKDFQKWHKLKLEIEEKHKLPFFREREIWWCSLGANIGVEEDGKNELFERPVLVFRKFNREMFWGLPMTSKRKEGKFFFTLHFHEEERSAILSQIRTLSGKRLIRRIGKISENKFEKIEKAVISLIKQNGPLAEPSSA